MWGVAGALLIWLLSFLIQALIPVVFLVPFLWHRGLNPSAPDFSQRALELVVTDRTGILIQVIAVLPAHLLVLAMLWAFVTRFGKRPFLASFGWARSGAPAWRERAGLIAVGVGLFLVATVIAKLLGTQKPTQMEELINSSIGARYTVAFLAVFTAPFVEEFIYRGVIYSALQRAIGINASVIFVIALFTAIHVPQYRQNIGVIFAIAFLSIVLTIVRAFSGRLLPCVIIHMAFNAVQAALLLVEPYLRHMITTTDPAVPTGSMILPLIRLVF